MLRLQHDRFIFQRTNSILYYMNISNEKFQLILKLKCRYISEESLYGLKENCLKTHGDGTHTQCIAVLVFILSHILILDNITFLFVVLMGQPCANNPQSLSNCANLLYLHQKRIHVKYFTHFD